MFVEKLKGWSRAVDAGRNGSEGFGRIEVGYARDNSCDANHQFRRIAFAGLHVHLITDKKFEGIVVGVLSHSMGNK